MKRWNGIVWVLLANCQFLLSQQLSAEPVIARRGMVVSSQRLASEVGVAVLKDGGNAVDAAVATAFALAVTHPTAGNLGGGGFMVIRFPDGMATTIDFREKAPLRAHRDMYLKEDGSVDEDKVNFGHLSAGVPGSPAGLELAVRKYGRKSVKSLIKPAIRLAEKGFPLSANQADEFNELRDSFLRFPASAKIFVRNDGRPWVAGDLFVQKDLAWTLKRIASHGAKDFYRGHIAKRIVADMEKNGGLIAMEDLRRYRAIERPPVRGNYRGHEIISMGPPSSGGITLIEMLNMLENVPLKRLGHLSADYVHLLSESMRRAFADRNQYLGDGDFVPLPTSGLISKAYAQQLFNTIDSIRATVSIELKNADPYFFMRESHETTHFSVVDEDGMAVAVTTTLNGGYGSMAVVEGVGFLLNNEMDDFAAKPGAPNSYELIQSEANAIAPEKRMLSSMTPTILAKDGRLFMIIGSPGGPTIINTVLNVILNVVEFDMDIYQAITAPRFHHQFMPDEIRYEKDGLPLPVMLSLQERGHHLRKVGRIGEAHGILYDAGKRLYYGAADPRGDGAAVGWE